MRQHLRNGRPNHRVTQNKFRQLHASLRQYLYFCTRKACVST
jgi:hypothetical protein